MKKISHNLIYQRLYSVLPLTNAVNNLQKKYNEYKLFSKFGYTYEIEPLHKVYVQIYLLGLIKNQFLFFIDSKKAYDSFIFISQEKFLKMLNNQIKQKLIKLSNNSTNKSNQEKIIFLIENLEQKQLKKLINKINKQKQI